MSDFVKTLNNANNIKINFIHNLSDIHFIQILLFLFSMNIRSISCHFDELFLLLSTINYIF